MTYLDDLKEFPRGTRVVVAPIVTPDSFSKNTLLEPTLVASTPTETFLPKTGKRCPPSLEKKISPKQKKVPRQKTNERTRDLLSSQSH